MKIIISKEFFLDFFSSNSIEKKKTEEYVINLLKKNYKFYISALSCLEISRILKRDDRAIFQSRIVDLCEEVIPLNFAIQKHYFEMVEKENTYALERSTSIFYGMDGILIPGCVII